MYPCQLQGHAACSGHDVWRLLLLPHHQLLTSLLPRDSVTHDIDIHHKGGHSSKLPTTHQISPIFLVTMLLCEIPSLLPHFPRASITRASITHSLLFSHPVTLSLHIMFSFGCTDTEHDYELEFDLFQIGDTLPCRHLTLPTNYDGALFGITAVCCLETVRTRQAWILYGVKK